MSMPKFPSPPNITLEDSITLIISSIAMEELALSHIINAEGEKIQYVLGTLEGSRAVVPPPSISIEDLLKVNESVKEMLEAVSMNQSFLLEKLSAAASVYCKLKECDENCDCKNDDDDDNNDDDDDDGDGDDDEPQLWLRDGEGPYDTRVDESDWDNKAFSMVMKIKFEYGVTDPHITIIEKGSIKLDDIFVLSDYSGISIRAEDPELSNHFWLSKDKVGDDAIVYDYYPDISVWDEAIPGTPVVEKTLIISKPGYKDEKIRVILRYNGSLYTRG